MACVRGENAGGNLTAPAEDWEESPKGNRGVTGAVKLRSYISIAVVDDDVVAGEFSVLARQGAVGGVLDQEEGLLGGEG